MDTEVRGLRDLRAYDQRRLPHRRAVIRWRGWRGATRKELIEL